MLLKLICCNVMAREACLALATSPHTVDPEFTEKGEHDRSDSLRALLQGRIDAAEAGDKRYDAILLGYGLCGNSVLGLAASRTRLVIPRAHDCCTLFLGSRLRFREHWADNPSRPFSATGYMERGGAALKDAVGSKVLGMDRSWRQLVEQYGEENAKYIRETLQGSVGSVADSPHDDRVVFIQTPEFAHLGWAERCRAQAEKDGKRYTELAGDRGLVTRLLHGEWNAEEFLVVEPGRSIGAVYDWDRIVDSV